jgi:hypothetical protein
MYRVRRFRLKKVFVSKSNDAKRDPFRFVFACSSENRGQIFSLYFASNFSHRFASSTMLLLIYEFKMKIFD